MGVQKQKKLVDGQNFSVLFFTRMKAYVSQEILNWHSLRHSLSADLWIIFLCLAQAIKIDANVSTMTMSKTMPAQNLWRYISFKNLNQKDLIRKNCMTSHYFQARAFAANSNEGNYSSNAK